MDDLVERVARLEGRTNRMERQLRGWKAAALVLAAVCCAALPRPGFTAAEGGVVRAPFRVLGENDQTLLEVRSDKGAAVLELRGKPKQPGVILRADEFGGNFATFDEKGSMTTSLSGLPGLGGHIQVNAATGKGTAIITAAPYGGSFHSTNFKGKRVALIGADAFEAGRIDLNSAEGIPAVVQMAGSEGGSIGVQNGEDHIGVILTMRENRGKVLVGAQKGHIGVSLDCTKDGGAVYVTSATRAGAVELGAGKGAALRITGKDEQRAVTLLSSVTGTNGLLLDDGSGNARCGLTIDDLGPQFEMRDVKGKAQVFLTSTEDGGRLQLYGKGAKPAYEAGVTPSGTGFQAVFGTTGSMAAALGVNTQNCGTVTVYNQAAATLGALSADARVGRLAIFEVTKGLLFEKP